MIGYLLGQMLCFIDIYALKASLICREGTGAYPWVSDLFVPRGGCCQ